ncbi:hypothetical protein [Mycolicibacterium palauense]|uniref:hypothetical protein n=1 Tax=Mycolicibacterium palauense TaxID=2034511 RepID=UPI00159BDAC9|nr:hypothetical protein [Mycolicibacterium palauense]
MLEAPSDNAGERLFEHYPFRWGDPLSALAVLGPLAMISAVFAIFAISCIEPRDR